MIVRVLQVIRAMNFGGAETFIMNVYRNIDRSKVQFDFLVSGEGKYDEEIRKMGGKIYKIPYITEVGQNKYVKELKQFFMTHPEYKIVHSHIDQVSGIIVQTANKCKIPTIISHSHNTKNSNGFIGKIYKKYLQCKINKNANIKIACGYDAAKWLYKKEADKAIIINNGIDVDKFEFSEESREKIRNQLGIKSSTIVIGHVGRFAEQKNHKFLLDIFKEYNKKNEDSVLLLVGDGSLREKINDKINSLNIRDKVMLLGNRNDVNELYSAFDVLVFPSLYEGLSVCLIEAQCNGLDIIASDTIDKATNIAGKIIFKSLKDSPKEWSEKLDSLNLSRQKVNREDVIKYDIKKIAYDMQTIYLEGAQK